MTGERRTPNALDIFSVSLRAAEGTTQAAAAAREGINDFASEIGWDPDRSEAIAGALQYREYDSFTRVLMRMVLKAGCHPTDVKTRTRVEAGTRSHG